MMLAPVGKVTISVIVPSGRGGAALRECLASLAAQQHAPPFEVIVVSEDEPAGPESLLLGWVRMEEKNPAARRNRAAEFAAGELFAFLDDDAAAAPDWLLRAAAKPEVEGLFGGPDLPRKGASYGERISDLLLATPAIGSGIAAHGRTSRRGEVRHPSDLALCNLFVRRPIFEKLGGFDESLGYIGEDTDFVFRAAQEGLQPQFDPEVIVFHRRRPFPGPYLAQRWRYRFKTGRTLLSRPRLLPLGKVIGFLVGGAVALAGGLLLGKRFLMPAGLLYAVLTWTLSAPIWIADPALFPVVPAAFLLHHGTYWLATLCGLLSGLWPRVASSERRAA
jgi:GT2 family glycosyltransferase